MIDWRKSLNYTPLYVKVGDRKVPVSYNEERAKEYKQYKDISAEQYLLLEIMSAAKQVSPHDFMVLLNSAKDNNLQSDEQITLLHNFITEKLSDKDRNYLMHLNYDDDKLINLYEKISETKSIPNLSNDYIQTISNVKRIREEKGITQLELAKKCNLTKNYVSSLERYVNKCSADTLILIAQALNVPVSALVGDMDTEAINPELYSLITSIDKTQQEKLIPMIRATLSLLNTATS